MVERLSKLPEVARVTTLNFFVPEDQDKKLAAIAVARDKIDPSFKPDAKAKPPTDEENVAALNEVVGCAQRGCRQACRAGRAPPAAKRLAAALDQARQGHAGDARRRRPACSCGRSRPRSKICKDLLQRAAGDARRPSRRDRRALADARTAARASRRCPRAIRTTTRRCANSPARCSPCSRTPSAGRSRSSKSGNTIVRAFFEAGAWALISIAILLWIVLRRFGDVLLTLVPLLLAGVVTLELCVVLGMPLNFANIIALPLLLGIGVAFKIYYIMAWRAGQTGLLQSSLTRAVFYSALTTATAFGSLWLSSHPGTSSMGKLLALSLLTTLAAAVLFQPVLMGKPRVLREA